MYTLEHNHYVGMCKYNERLKSLFTILWLLNCLGVFWPISMPGVRGVRYSWILECFGRFYFLRRMTLTYYSSDLPGWNIYIPLFFPLFSGLMSVITNWKPYRADGVLEEERTTCQIVEDGRLHLLFLDNGVNSWLFVCIFYLLIIGLRMNGFFKTSSIRESVIFMCWFLILCACISVSGKKQKNQKTISPSSNQTEVIQRLSNFFGIDRIPGRIFRKPPPDYMIDLYNSITDSGGLMKRESPYKADVIRSFPDRRE